MLPAAVEVVMRRVVVVVACAVALGGCKTAAERTSEVAEQAEILCKSARASGPVAYESCRRDMIQRLIAVQASERAARADAVGSASQALGAALLAPRPQAPGPFTCTSNTFAGMTTTQCQ